MPSLSRREDAQMNAQAEGPAQHLPLCGVGLRREARPRLRPVGGSGDEEHPANLGRLCSRARRWPRRSSTKGVCSIRNRRRTRVMERGARRWSPEISGRSRRMVRIGRLLRLRPNADRGLLRRQQADEGLHRFGQHRHQFATLHGLFCRRHTSGPSAPTLCPGSTRIWNRPISSCWSAPISPGAIRCCSSDGGRQGIAAESAHRQRRSAPHGDERAVRYASGAGARF